MLLNWYGQPYVWNDRSAHAYQYYYPSNYHWYHWVYSCFDSCHHRTVKLKRSYRSSQYKCAWVAFRTDLPCNDDIPNFTKCKCRHAGGIGWTTWDTWKLTNCFSRSTISYSICSRRSHCSGILNCARRGWTKPLTKYWSQVVGTPVRLCSSAPCCSECGSCFVNDCPKDKGTHTGEPGGGER